MDTLMYYIGLQIIQYSGDQVTINLKFNLCRALEVTRMRECKAVSMAMKAKTRLLPRVPDVEASYVDITQYQELAWHCQRAASITLPDIARATAKLGEFSVNPSSVHDSILKYLNRYMRGTLYYGL